MKKIIGIISNVSGFDSNDPFKDRYYTLNTYVKKIKEMGGIPIIIPPVDLIINEEALNLCAAFLIPGGILIKQFHLDVVDYALKNNKKLLGICMGMQVLGMYSNKESEDKSLVLVNNHYVDEGITYDNKEILVHEIYIKPKSNLSAILEKNNLMVNSIHHYALREVRTPFDIVAKSSDGIIEAIEYKNVLGVQFHPELMHDCDNLFKWLVE